MTRMKAIITMITVVIVAMVLTIRIRMLRNIIIHMMFVITTIAVIY